MIITVKERTEDHLSHDAHSASIRMWDVLQGDVLVGIYHSEKEAMDYKELLERGEADGLKELTKK
ncbi:MAG: hypothetical protein ACOH2R_05670 [Pseudomonas sp.]